MHDSLKYERILLRNCDSCGQVISGLTHRELQENVKTHKKEGCNPIKKSSTSIQVDGSHYKNLSIQPAIYSYKNFGPAWHQGEIIKYVTRYKNKNGRVDLEKARHLIDMLIELEYES